LADRRHLLAYEQLGGDHGPPAAPAFILGDSKDGRVRGVQRRRQRQGAELRLGIHRGKNPQKLADDGVTVVRDSIVEYGVDLDLDPEEVRLPLARAMLYAVRELATELTRLYDWDVERRGRCSGSW